MIKNIDSLADLFTALKVSDSRVAMLKAAANEFDAEVAADTIYNVTASSVKDALSTIQRMFDSVRNLDRINYESPEAKQLGDLYHELPYSIDGGTIKKAIRNLDAAIAITSSASYRDNLALQLRICKVFATCADELRAVKDKLIKGRKGAQTKEQASAYLAEQLNTPIAKVVEPIKAQVVDAGEAKFRNRVALVKAELEKAGWNMNLVAPYPMGFLPRREFAQAQNKNLFYSSLTKIDKDKYTVVDRRELYVVWSDEAVEHKVGQVRAATAADFDAYVCKLNTKVGEHTAAALVFETNYLWSNSTIDVSKLDGTVERWNTKTIVNCSVLGLVFNQWPTRKVS
jgi:hypothetical protein